MGAIALAPLAAAVVLGVAVVVVRLQRRHQARLLGALAPPGDSERADILYFTGANCTICHVAQRPALARLTSAHADVVVREVDVAVEPALARRYRVMTLPTTIVFDDRDRIAAINTGFTSEVTLREQLAGAGRRAGSAAPA
jgi:hypothetical protein